MKVLFAIKAMDESKGGAERVLADVAGGLAVCGHDVSLLSFDKAGGQPFYPLHQNIKRFSLGIGDSQKHARFFETIKRMLEVRKEVKRQQPDVVIAFMHSMFIPVIIALVGTGIPVIASEHIVPQHYKDKKLEFGLLVVCGLLSKKITVLSDRIKNLYPKILHSRIEVVPNPIVMPDMLAKPSADTAAQKIILNIGRLVEQKDQKTLIEAFALLAHDFPDWCVRIVGEGALATALQNLIDAKGLQNRVILAGTTKEIGQEYLNAHIFALPSLYEGFGLVTVEAMSYGLPTLGFADCPGTNELIVDGENGLLADGTSRAQAFAEKLKQLMMSSELRWRLGQKGLQTARQFAPDHVLDLWENLIRTP